MAFGLLLLGPAVSAARFRDDFETQALRWRMHNSATGLRVIAHRSDVQERHSGQASESLVLQANRGHWMHLTYAVTPAHVIDELAPSVWVKSNQSGIRLAGRIVFPQARDPHTGNVVTALVQGDSYSDPGQWQQLAVRQLAGLVKRQHRVLRQQLGGHISAEGAYLDLLVLQAPGGRHPVRIWIDDLEVRGHVAVSPVSERGDPTAPAGAGGDSPRPATFASEAGPSAGADSGSCVRMASTAAGA